MTYDPTFKFYVGQDVVCVDDKFAPGQRVIGETGLVEGRVYKIRWLGMFDNYVDGPMLGIKVLGIHRGVDKEYGFEDPPFRATRFRPVQHDPIAVFRQIAVDPDGYVPVGPEGPRRKLPVREKEEV